MPGDLACREKHQGCASHHPGQTTPLVPSTGSTGMQLTRLYCAAHKHKHTQLPRHVHASARTRRPKSAACKGKHIPGAFARQAQASYSRRFNHKPPTHTCTHLQRRAQGYTRQFFWCSGIFCGRLRRRPATTPNTRTHAHNGGPSALPAA